MNLLEHVRQWEASRDEWAELAKTCWQMESAGPGDPRWERMAVLCESYADRLERPGPVRWFTTREVTPESLRVESAQWRAGRVPSWS